MRAAAVSAAALTVQPQQAAAVEEVQPQAVRDLAWAPVALRQAAVQGVASAPEPLPEEAAD